MATPKGIDYWIDWMHDLEKWISKRPKGMKNEDYYEVENVAWQDLREISVHFSAKLESENYEHRQKVEIMLSATSSITFSSPKRSFTYDDLHL